MIKLISSLIAAPFAVITFYCALDKYTHLLFNIKTVNADDAITFLNFMLTVFFAVGLGIVLYEKGFFQSKK